MVLACTTWGQAATIGIDFGSPTIANWNAAGGGSNTQVLTDLLDEDGAVTDVDLSYDGVVNANTIVVNYTPNASQIPTHSSSLSDIGGALGDATGIQFTFDDLLPHTLYDVWVFGANPFLKTVHDVTITGAGTPVNFTQTLSPSDSQDLWVNGQVGTNAPLSTFAVTVSSTAGGQLFIDVLEGGDLTGPGVDIAGLAISRAATPEPSSVGLLGMGLLFISATVRRRTRS